MFLSGFVFDKIICIAVKIFPALQKPHNLIPAFVKPFIISVYISGTAAEKWEKFCFSLGIFRVFQCFNVFFCAFNTCFITN